MIENKKYKQIETNRYACIFIINFIQKYQISRVFVNKDHQYFQCSQLKIKQFARAKMGKNLVKPTQLQISKRKHRNREYQQRIEQQALIDKISNARNTSSWIDKRKNFYLQHYLKNIPYAIVEVLNISQQTILRNMPKIKKKAKQRGQKQWLQFQSRLMVEGQKFTIQKSICEQKKQYFNSFQQNLTSLNFYKLASLSLKYLKAAPKRIDIKRYEKQQQLQQQINNRNQQAQDQQQQQKSDQMQNESEQINEQSISKYINKYVDLNKNSQQNNSKQSSYFQNDSKVPNKVQNLNNRIKSKYQNNLDNNNNKMVSFLIVSSLLITLLGSFGDCYQSQVMPKLNIKNQVIQQQNANSIQILPNSDVQPSQVISYGTTQSNPPKMLKIQKQTKVFNNQQLVIIITKVLFFIPSFLLLLALAVINVKFQPWSIWRKAQYAK